MLIEQLAPFPQDPQSAFTGDEIFLPGISKRQPSLASAHQQQIQVFFEPGQSPAYCGSRQLEMGCHGAECSRLGSGNEYADIIKIGRFAHAQYSCAITIIVLRSGIGYPTRFT
jgi:hypothetical protein